MYCRMCTAVVGEAVHFGMNVFLCTLGCCEVNLGVAGRVLWFCGILCIVFRVFKL